uniref:Uncharacterized protein n=1 Tax=Ditylenchus dipsaci TaxID=166011 RepID=A0A915E4G1_9BILA
MMKNSTSSITVSSSSSINGIANGSVVTEGTDKGENSSSKSTSSSVVFENGFEPNFEWKVFEKLCKSSKQKGTEQSEAELTYMLELLAKADALEWIYLLCIMRQDVKLFNTLLLNELHNQKRMVKFLENVREGTSRLYFWCENRCPAYRPIFQIFKEFVDH